MILKDVLLEELQNLDKLKPDQLVKKRIDKFSNIGVVAE